MHLISRKLLEFALVIVLVLHITPISYALARKGSRARGLTSRSSVRVRPHTRKNGKWVPRHRRTSPNKSKLDNWSTKGNINPYTGKSGTINP